MFLCMVFTCGADLQTQRKSVTKNRRQEEERRWRTRKGRCWEIMKCKRKTLSLCVFPVIFQNHFDVMGRNFPTQDMTGYLHGWQMCLCVCVCVCVVVCRVVCGCGR